MNDDEIDETNGLRDVFGRTFTLKDDLRQRDVAAWNRAYANYDFGPRVARADERQAALQAAIEAGWIVSPPVLVEHLLDVTTGATSRRYTFDGVLVDDMQPAEVNYYGLLCSRKFEAVMAVPKASIST